MFAVQGLGSLEGLGIPKPPKYVKNSPKPIITDMKAIILHTSRVQVGLRVLTPCPGSGPVHATRFVLFL